MAANSCFECKIHKCLDDSSRKVASKWSEERELWMDGRMDSN